MRLAPPPHPERVSDTREKIIQLADDFIRRRGYNAFSYRDISEALGVKPAAVHYHFPNKEALGAAILEREIVASRDNEAHWKRLSPDEQLRNLVGIFAGYRRRGLTCLMGSFCQDYDTLPGLVQTNLRTLCRVIQQWVTTVLAQGRRIGVLRFDGEPADRARLVMSTLMSSLLLSRVQGDDVFDNMTKQLLKDLIV